MDFFRQIASITKSSIESFIDDNCFQFSAAVSFYTLFSLAPVIYIAIHIAGVFATNEIIVSEIRQFFTEFFGPESSEGLMILVDNLNSEYQSIVSVIVSVLILLFSATNLFIQMKGSFNKIFGVRTKEGKDIVKILIDRLVSLLMIALLGIALIFSLLLDSIVVSFFKFMSNKFDSVEIIFASLGGNLVTVLIVFIAVLLLFSILPDVKLSWSSLAKGSFITAVLLTIGKFIIGWIIGKSTLLDLSGASTSVIILMMWIFYSSMILFFGIELIKAISEANNKSIRPNKYSTRIKFIEVEES